MASQIKSLILTLFAIVLVAFVGYFIFINYMTVFVPNIASYSLLLIAVVAGVAAFFNPCNFAVLPAYLTYYYSASDSEKAQETKGKIRTVFFYGLIAALGVIAFNLILGVLIGAFGASLGKSFGLAGDSPNLFVRIFRGIIGSSLIVLGIFHFKGVSFHSGFVNKITQKLSISGQTSPAKGLFTFGFLYNAVGIGCGGPILAGLSLFAFSTGGFFSVLFAFLVFSLTMATLMLLISLLVGFSKGTMIKKLNTSAPTIKKLSGAIMVLVGLILLLSSIFTNEFVSVLFPG